MDNTNKGILFMNSVEIPFKKKKKLGFYLTPWTDCI